MSTSRTHRALRVETLEPRMMLAGDTYLINFQFDEASIPTRYQRDVGAVFGDRGNGLTYGWSVDHTDQSRERNADPDQRYDTLIHIEAGQDWEFQLPNGLYEVTVAVGDPGNNDGVHTINVEGVNYFNAVPDTDSPLVATNQITVSDGRLTIDSGAAANMATRINFVHVVGLPSGPNAAPATPAITEPAVDGQEVNPSDVHMEAIGFADAEGDLHKSSDWEIWTVGPSAHSVWQTLGIEGVERLHTHMGDGIFFNSRAGETSIAQNTDHELRVRFRDDTGAVSAYGSRLFTTGPLSATFPLELQDVAASPTPTWENVFGTPVDLPSGATILSPADPIIAIDTDGGSASPGGEAVGNAIDGTLGKYLNFGEENSGFIVTPSVGASIVKSFQITTANDAPERDPNSWELYGTNQVITSGNHSDGDDENWTLIDSGAVNLPGARDVLDPMVSVDNNTAYTSYRMIFTGVKNAGAANSMQIAEIQFFGDDVTETPHELRLEAGSTGELLLAIEATEAPGNIVTHYPPLVTEHAELRVVVQAGSKNLALTQSNLNFTDDLGIARSIFLPSVNLLAGQRLDLWVSTTGSTYFGTAAQTEPDFSNLARLASDIQVPFVATQPGFVVEVVGTNYRLPVNIAFVPDPGPNPDDPLYYVTELYGSIQVVTNDGTKQTFATGLLDYNPQGPISGSGEQGLSGIAVRRDPTNPEIYQLFVGMLWDNGSPAGGASHYPKVERIESAPGGLSMDSRTVLLNMQPETQGQSHQISNVTIGPDGLLYVHNGDGFNASTAQDLDQFRGKVLRMNLDGTAPTNNPFYDASNGITARDYIFAYGFRNPFGGAWRASDGIHYSVENGPSVDRLNQVLEGVNYGWDGSDASMLTNAIYNWDPSHAPVNIAFIQPETFGGSQFPDAKMDRAFVSESGPTYAPGVQSRGKRIVEFVLDEDGNRIGGPIPLVEYTGTGHSTIVGLAAGPDGLYFTELYEDSGDNNATAIGARVYRVRYANPLQGDYNIDGTVNQEDHAVWASAFGSSSLLAADGNRDGVVNAADYTVWRDRLGSGLVMIDAASASSNSVLDKQPSQPEASSASQVTGSALNGSWAKPTTRSTTRTGVSVNRSEISSDLRDQALLLAVAAAPEADDSSYDSLAKCKATSSEGNDTAAVDDAFAEFDTDLGRWL